MADREKAVLALRKELEMVSHILNPFINGRMKMEFLRISFRNKFVVYCDEQVARAE